MAKYLIFIISLFSASAVFTQTVAQSAAKSEVSSRAPSEAQWHRLAFETMGTAAYVGALYY